MKNLFFFFVLSAITISLQVNAQKLSIGYQGDGGMKKPAHGLTMESVVQKYGQPVKQVPAKGNPPIIRWVYDGFTVYFEGNIVIHSVTNKK